MKISFSRLLLIALGLSALSLSSCGIARSLIQIPGRTLKSAGRSVGFGLEMTETTPAATDAKQAR